MRIGMKNWIISGLLDEDAVIRIQPNHHIISVLTDDRLVIEAKTGRPVADANRAALVKGSKPMVGVYNADIGELVAIRPDPGIGVDIEFHGFDVYVEPSGHVIRLYKRLVVTTAPIESN